MKSICFAVLLLALPVFAQDDRVFLNNGSMVDQVTVTSFDIRELKYSKGGTSTSIKTDQIAKVDLAAFKDAFRLGLRDPDLMLTKARETLAEKETLLAQLGFVAASAMFFDRERPQEASAALDELQKAIPDAGVTPEVFRQKFEYYMGQPDGKGAKNAQTIAKKYVAEAQGGAWPSGLAVEGEFFVAMADRSVGGNAKEYQTKLTGLIAVASGENAMVANRANVQLANSLRETKDLDRARKIYEDLVGKAGVDSSSRAGAYLGLGSIVYEEAGTDQEANKRALLLFLRVYLETRDAWPSLQAESLYYAALAAGKWRGPEFQYIQARCRGVLKNEFPASEWTNKALKGL